MLNKSDSMSSSLRRSTTNSASKKSTPSWNKRYPKRNDSNIVTSPVKTLRQFGGESSDEYDTTTNYDDTNGAGNHESTTVNVPLKSSPKKPLRKGTPKLPKTKQRESKSPRKPVVSESAPKRNIEEESEPKRTSIEAKSAPIESAVDRQNSSTRRIIINSHINHNISTHDDEEDYGAHHNSNNTLLSEIPSDILSPEKHIYPPENLRRSSNNSSAVKPPKEATKSILSSIPIISPPKSRKPDTTIYHQEVHTSTFEKLLNSNAKENNEPESVIGSSVNRGTSLPPSLYPSIAPFDEEFDDEVPEKKIASDIIDSRVIAKERETISERKRKESESISIFFQKSNSKSPSLSEERRSLVSPKNQESPKSSNIPRDNTSYHHLSEFIKNPLIDHDKYKPSQTPKESTVSSKEDTKHRRSSHVLDLSQFESSDEEPVPELTVPLGEEPTEEASKEEIGSKRTFEPIETSTNKRLKSSLYPTLPSQSPTKRSEPPVSKPLYPQLKPFLKFDGDDKESVAPIQKSQPGPQSVRQLREEETGETEEPLGDADNWTKAQWRIFFQAFKKFKRTNDFSIFNTRLLEYLRCDQHEIKLKIQFAMDYEDTLRKKRD